MGYRTAQRWHDFCYGHRVLGHENKCAHLHGHNGRVHFVVAGDLDDIGRVIDFSEIGRRLCNWVEDYWDHHFLIFEDDPWRETLARLDKTVVWVPFNPTAENIAQYLVEAIGPQQLAGTGATLVECTLEETRKCSATYHKSIGHTMKSVVAGLPDVEKVIQAAEKISGRSAKP